MIEERGLTYVLRGKTGWAWRLSADGDRFADCLPIAGDVGPPVTPEIGWYVGYVERRDRVVFFALNLEIRKVAEAAARRGIVKRILQEETLLP